MGDRVRTGSLLAPGYPREYLTHLGFWQTSSFYWPFPFSLTFSLGLIRSPLPFLPALSTFWKPFALRLGKQAVGPLAVLGFCTPLQGSFLASTHPQRSPWLQRWDKGGHLQSWVSCPGLPGASLRGLDLEHSWFIHLWTLTFTEHFLSASSGSCPGPAGLLFVLSKDKVAEAQSRHLIPNSKFPALRVHHSILVPIFGVTCLSHP